MAQRIGMWGLAVFTTFLLGFAGGAQKCLECSDLPRPEDCSKTTQCGSSEKCYTQEFVTSGGLLLYNTGCMSKTRCRIQKRRSHRDLFFGRRQNTDIPTCTDCCDGDFCNMQGCGATVPMKSQRGPVCFSCEQQLDPESCRDVTFCDRDEACLLRQYVSGSHIVYRSSCERKVACSMMGSHMHLLGKREKRSTFHSCPKCCDEDFCNHNCIHNRTVSSIAATSTMANRVTPGSTPTTVKNQSSRTTAYKHTVDTTATATVNMTTIPTTVQKAQISRLTNKAIHPTPVKSTVPTVKVIVNRTTAATTVHRKSAKTIPPKATAKTTITQTTSHTVASASTRHQHTTRVHKRTTTVHIKANRTTHTKLATAMVHKTTTPKASAPKSTAPSIRQTTSDPAAACLSDHYKYYPRFDLCLIFHLGPKNWTDAETYCQRHAGTLAIVDTQTKMNSFQSVMHLDPKHASGEFWVGASDKFQFLWLNGNLVSFNSTQLADMRNHHCVAVDASYPQFVKSNLCPELRAFICERKKSIH